MLAVVRDEGHKQDAGAVHVIQGLGGVGKTSVAVSVAHRLQRETDQVWWIGAQDASRFTGGLTALARQLGVPDEEIAVGRLADQLWRRLSALEEPWLLVVDNADDARLLDGPGRLALGTGLVRPHRSPRGLVLVTSRDGQPGTWGDHAVLHRLTPLGDGHGADVLLDLAGPTAGSREEAAELARRLGGLPLALNTVGRYLAAVGQRPARFRDAGETATFAEFRASLDDGGAFPHPGTATALAGIWRMSLDLLTERGHRCVRPLLEVLANFADAPVPLILADPAVLGEDEAFEGVGGAEIWAALQALAGLGLVDLAAANGVDTVALHPLVRDAHGSPGRYALNVRLLGEAAESDETGQPEDVERWPLWSALTPHAVHALAFEDDSDDDRLFLETCWVTNLVAGSLRAQGQLSQARKLLEELVSRQGGTLGEDHSDALTCRHNLASVLHLQGHHDRARTIYEDILATQLSTHGETHPGTLTIRHNLASVLHDQGHLDQARTIYEDMLTNRLSIHGASHPDTVAARHELARVLHNQGDLDQARTIYEDILTTQLSTHGETHPDALTIRHNLARVLYNQGHHDLAAAEMAAILSVRRRVIGPEHPYTLDTQAWLDIINAARGEP
ncbi:tetratricopeptide repeat protein [Streptomyces sp. L-9-10]|uniref:tetratricopeptide repeat protein n=1 Tax=Streptomyces sp. L-9-10 TaxID=1478131 RepID=UPI0023D91636|nr:tetratricopeptide repeat protein [Streptomyces sp. L-9-10]